MNAFFGLILAFMISPHLYSQDSETTLVDTELPLASLELGSTLIGNFYGFKPLAPLYFQNGLPVDPNASSFNKKSSYCNVLSKGSEFNEPSEYLLIGLAGEYSRTPIKQGLAWDFNDYITTLAFIDKAGEITLVIKCGNPVSQSPREVTVGEALAHLSGLIKVASLVQNKDLDVDNSMIKETRSIEIVANQNLTIKPSPITLEALYYVQNGKLTKTVDREMPHCILQASPKSILDRINIARGETLKSDSFTLAYQKVFVPQLGVVYTDHTFSSVFIVDSKPLEFTCFGKSEALFTTNELATMLKPLLVKPTDFK